VVAVVVDRGARRSVVVEAFEAVDVATLETNVD
jgi:hypothetical protein